MEAVAAQLETKASASNGQYPEVHEDEETASAKLRFGTQDPTVSEKSDNMVAHYWYNELKSRLAQGDDKARLSPSEINQIMEVFGFDIIFNTLESGEVQIGGDRGCDRRKPWSGAVVV